MSFHRTVHTSSSLCGCYRTHHRKDTQKLKKELVCATRFFRCSVHQTKRKLPWGHALSQATIWTPAFAFIRMQIGIVCAQGARPWMTGTSKQYSLQYDLSTVESPLLGPIFVTPRGVSVLHSSQFSGQIAPEPSQELELKLGFGHASLHAKLKRKIQTCKLFQWLKLSTQGSIEFGRHVTSYQCDQLATSRPTGNVFTRAAACTSNAIGTNRCPVAIRTAQFACALGRQEHSLLAPQPRMTWTGRWTMLTISYDGSSLPSGWLGGPNRRSQQQMTHH